MHSTFLFIDESVSKHLDTASLTGVLVSSDRYVAARDAVLRLSIDLQRRIQQLAHDVMPPAIEFHGCEMLNNLQGATDDDKIVAFAALVDIVNRERLTIISTGYTNRAELAEVLSLDHKLQGANFFNMLLALDEFAHDRLIVPIFDGLPGGTLEAEKKKVKASPIEPAAFRAFIASVHSSQNMRVGLGDRALSIRNLRNFAEPVFTDTEHSPLLQLADVIGYLLHLQDWRARFHISGFKARVAELAERLDPTLVAKRRGRAEITR